MRHDQIISLKKYLDTAEAGQTPGISGRNDNVLSATLDAYRSTLREMGNSGAAVCPSLGANLQRELERLGKGLTGTIGAVASTEAGMQRLLQDWGRQTVHHFQQRAGEIKDILLVIARAAESVGHRDERCSQQIHAVTARLQKIANLDDLIEIRSTIEQSALDLRESVEKMNAEGRAVINHLRAEVSAYQTKLEQAEYIAACDSMTGLGSRLWMEERIKHRIDMRTPFCAVMIDVDEFKDVNDKHGHHVGDLLLKEFAAELRSACRSGDTLGRWRGDEFIVLLDCHLADAKAQIERVMAWICGDYTVTGRSGKLKLRLDASVCIAEHRQNETLQELVDRADAEMYLHKNSPCTRKDGLRHVASA
jgi:diguanylate cyclase (GGDEF)-like protein